jgi:hypothetical protein
MDYKLSYLQEGGKLVDYSPALVPSLSSQMLVEHVVQLVLRFEGLFLQVEGTSGALRRSMFHLIFLITG